MNYRIYSMNKFDESRRRKHRVTLRLDDEEYKLLCEWSADEREFRAGVDSLWRVVAEFSRAMSRGGIKFGSNEDMGIE